MPATVPFNVKVNEPSVNVLLAPVKVSALFTVGLPVNENALAEPALNSRFPNLAPDMLFATPVMLIFPLPVLVCVPAPVIFPAQVITFPLSASVPVRISAVPTLRLFPSVVVPALATNEATLFVVPGVVWSK